MQVREWVLSVSRLFLLESRHFLFRLGPYHIFLPVCFPKSLAMETRVCSVSVLAEMGHSADVFGKML